MIFGFMLLLEKFTLLFLKLNLFLFLLEPVGHLLQNFLLLSVIRVYVFQHRCQFFVHRLFVMLSFVSVLEQFVVLTDLLDQHFVEWMRVSKAQQTDWLQFFIGLENQVVE